MFSIIIRNIITNAIKFVNNDSWIIEFKVDKIEKKWLFYFKFFIKDNWVWIPKNILPHILWDWFYSTTWTNYEKWTWLWLKLVKKYIKELWWDLWVESEGEWKWTTFWFTLPV
jgi:signal transduction histidine kinase